MLSDSDQSAQLQQRVDALEATTRALVTNQLEALLSVAAVRRDLAGLLDLIGTIGHLTPEEREQLRRLVALAAEHGDRLEGMRRRALDELLDETQG